MSDPEFLQLSGLSAAQHAQVEALLVEANALVAAHSDETPADCPACGERDWIRDGHAARRRGEPVQVFRCRSCGKKRVGHSDSPFKHPLFPAGAMLVAVMLHAEGWTMQRIAGLVRVLDGKGKWRSPNRQTVGRWVKRLRPLIDASREARQAEPPVAPAPPVAPEPPIAADVATVTSVSGFAPPAGSDGPAEPPRSERPPTPVPIEPLPARPVPPPFDVGALVARRYEVVEQLAGGSGGVFVVRDTWLPGVAEAALKVVVDGADLEHEFELRARLRHPNVAGVLDYGVLADGRHWFTQELVRGADLFDASREAPLERILEWMVGVLRGCAYLHGRQILHRDLKPENILLGRDGVPRIVDFGISLSADDARDRAAAPAGSLGYLAPEVLDGAAPDATVDLYAVGVTFYHVLARRLPAPGTAFPSLGTVRADAPVWLDTLLARMASADRGRRYASALGVIDAIVAHSGIRFARETASTLAARIEGGAMVGRERAMAVLDAALTSEPEAGAPRGALVHGPPGIGKTRLLQAWRQRWQLRGGEVVQAPVGTVIRAMAARLGTGHRLLRQHADVIARLTGGDADHPLPTRPRDGMLHDREVVLELLGAGQTPELVVMVDQAESVDEPTFAVLEALVGAPGQAPRLLVAARLDAGAPEERVAALRALTQNGLCELELPSLSQAAVQGMIEEAFDQSPIAAELAPRIARATEGNPRFVEEVLRGLVEQRVVRRDEAGGWRTDAPDALPVPRQLVDACRARVLALAEPERSALAQLAAAGGMIPRVAAATLHPEDVLAELVGRALVRVQDDTIGAAHDAVSAAALAGLSAPELVRLRLLIAGAIEEALSDPAARPVELLAQVFVEAGEPARALPYLQRAARRAAERWDVAQALHWLGALDEILSRRTVSSADIPDGLEEQTLRDLVKMLRFVGRHDEESVCLDRLTLVAQMQGNTSLLHDAAALKALYWFDRGRLDLARQICRGHLGPARDSGDRLSLARFLWVMALIERSEGNTEEGIALSDEVLELLGEAVDPERLELRVQNLVNRGNAFGQTGRLDRAVSAFERGLNLCRQHGLTSKAILCTMNLGVCHAMQCRYGPALGHFDRARQDAARLGLHEMARVLQANQAEVERHLGLWSVAAERCESLLGAARERSAAMVVRSARCTLASCRVVLGDLPGAAELIELAVRRLEPGAPGDGRVWLTEAEVRLAEGTREARDRARNALHRIVGGDPRPNPVAPHEAALAHAMLAAMALADGEIEQATSESAQALSRHESGPREVREGLIEVLYIRARVLLARGELDEAGTLLESAIAELGRQCVEVEGWVREAFLSIPLHRELAEDARRVLGRSLGLALDVGGGAPSAQVRELRDVLQTARRLTRATGLSAAVEIVLEAALRHGQLDRAFLLTREEERYVALGGRRNGRTALEPGACRPPAPLLDAMARLRRPVTEHEARGSSSTRPREDGPGPEFQRLAIPLCYGDGLIGALYLESDSKVAGLDEHRMTLLEAVGDQAAMAVQHHLQVGEIERLRRRAEADLTRTRARLAEESARRERAERAAAAERRMSKLRYSYDQIVHASPQMADVLSQVDRVVDRKITVMVTGESGTGKELIARALHYSGPRADGPFVAINCGAIPSNLIESELFGHMRGAFTGAHKDRRGHFELAHRGTLFLDEIGEIRPEVQVRLLRVLENGEVTPVGSSRRIKVDVRIVCATNRDLKTEVGASRFREDLFYRLNTITIQLPPLRDRPDDIPLLVDHFARMISEDRGEPMTRFGPRIMARLTAHTWPGNIRELRNVVEYATLFAESGEVPPNLTMPF